MVVVVVAAAVVGVGGDCNVARFLYARIPYSASLAPSHPPHRLGGGGVGSSFYKIM